MQLQNLKIKNFKSFVDTKISFTDFGNNNILILGENRDSEGNDSNESGKTALFDAISFALFGKIPISESVDDIIKAGTSQCEVEFSMINNGESLRINRKRGKIDSLEYWVNGSDDHPKSTNTITQNALLEYLGISLENKEYYNDFLNTTYFSVDLLKSFASKQTTSEDRMKLVSRFLNLDKLEKAYKVAMKKRKDLQKETDSITMLVQSAQNELTGMFSFNEIENQIKDENKLKEQKVKELKEIEEKIEEAKETFEARKRLDGIEDEIISLKKNKIQYFELLKNTYKQKEEEIEKLENLQRRKKEIESELSKIPQFGDLDIIIDERERELERNNNKREKNWNLFREKLQNIELYKSMLKESMDCPECKTSLMYNSGVGLQKLDKDEAYKKIKILVEEKDGFEKKYTKYDLKRTELSSIIDKTKEVNSGVKKLLFEIDYINNETYKLDIIEKDLIELKEKEKIRFEEYETQENTLKIEQQKLIDKTSGFSFDMDKAFQIKNDLKQEISDADREIGKCLSLKKVREEEEKQLQKIKQDLKSKEKIVSDYSILEDCYPTIRRWKIETFLPEFQETVNKYLRKLKCGLQTNMDLMKLKKSAKKDENKYKIEFKPEVIDSAGYVRNFSTFSKGASIRVAICTGLALRDIALKRGSVKFDFMLIDEILDGVDKSGDDEILLLLESIIGQKFIISHNDDFQNRFRSVIKIIKENNVSRIEQ